MEFCKMNVRCSKHQNYDIYEKKIIRAFQQRFEPNLKADHQTQPPSLSLIEFYKNLGQKKGCI